MVRPQIHLIFPVQTSLAFLALAGSLAADVPEKVPYTKYSGLWTNSPFTSKPPPAEAGPENNPLDDYALIGVSSLGDKKYRVTIINKKKPEEPRIYVESDRESKGFKIVGVTRKPGDPTGTVVSMTSGSMMGNVSYDQKLLTLTAVVPKAPAPQPGQQIMPGQPPVPGQPGAPQRQPRPRVVPPPTPTAGEQGQPAQPVQPVQAVQPGQPQPVPQNFPNNQRPQRRGN